jgi:hypothetical protein
MPVDPRAHRETLVSVMSKTQQEKTLDEGLALGAAMLGSEEVVWSLVGSEGAFRRAWSDWSYSHLFPSIRVDVARSDIKRILRMSDRRRGPRASGWTGAGSYSPWTDGDEWNEVANIISEEIPAAARRDLVGAWLTPPSTL